MFLELCFSVTLQDERGEAVPMKCSCSLQLGICMPYYDTV